MVVASQELLALCTIVATLTIGEVPTIIRLLPRGRCHWCCPLDEKRDITFSLFTRFNPKKGDALAVGDDDLLYRSHINKYHPTVVYVHGFTENVKGASSRGIRDAYLKRGGWNVVLVDWSSLCAPPYYNEAVLNTKVVGHYLAKFLAFLNDRGLPLDTIHVIGFSLGAQVGGLAGKELNGSLYRITGLDPAFPFYMRPRAHRLDATDAQFVDVIHGDSGVFGYPTRIGHADFFPNNGGPVQPGCKVLSGVVRDPDNVYAFLACSHQRSWRYYAESVLNERGFLASTCRQWLHDRPGDCRVQKHRQNNMMSYMGFAADRSARGKFYLTTYEKPPFAKNLTLNHSHRKREVMLPRHRLTDE